MKLPALSIFLEPTLLKLIDKIWDIVNTLREPPGLYKILDFKSSLEICDPLAKSAFTVNTKKYGFYKIMFSPTSIRLMAKVNYLLIFNVHPAK